MSNMVVNTNVLALNSHRAMKNVGTAQARASARLSSGLKINSAADDAAGLAISEKMRAQIRGLDMASKNSQDAISLIQTAEGGMQEINNMVQRIRELVVYAANDTLDPNNGVAEADSGKDLFTGSDLSNIQAGDRQKVQDEINYLMKEIDSMANRVEFNKKKLINGTYDYKPGVAGTEAKGAEDPETLAASIALLAEAFKEDPETLAAVAAKYAELYDDTIAMLAVGENAYNTEVEALKKQKAIDLSTEDVLGTPTDAQNQALLDAQTEVNRLVEERNLIRDQITALGLADPGDVPTILEAADMVNATISKINDALSALSDLLNGTCNGITVDAGVLTKIGANTTIEDLFSATGFVGLPLETATVGSSAPVKSLFDDMVAGDLSDKTDLGTIIDYIKGALDTSSNALLGIDFDDLNNAGDNTGSVLSDTGYTQLMARFDNLVAELEAAQTVYENAIDADAGATDWQTGVGDYLAAALLTVETALGDIIEPVEADAGPPVVEAQQAKGKDTAAAGSASKALYDAQLAVDTAKTTVVTPGTTVVWTDVTDAQIDLTTANSEKARAISEYVPVNYDTQAEVPTTIPADAEEVILDELLAEYLASDEYAAAVALLEEEAGILPEVEGTEATGERLWFQVGANSEQGWLMSIGNITCKGLGLATGPITEEGVVNDKAKGNFDPATLINVLKFTGGPAAKNADGTLVDPSKGDGVTDLLQRIDAGLTVVATERSKLGAAQNRLEYTIRSLDISSENLSASESRIRDTDMAKEMMNLTKANVLQQAAVSMLAQANQAPQQILQLLR